MNQLFAHNPEDKQLVERVLRGDNQAFGIIIKATENLVAQIVCRMIPVEEDRKDLAQDIYLKAFKHLSGFKFQSKLSTWIAQIAYNTCISWVEKKKPFLPGNLQEDEKFSPTTESTHYSATTSSDSEKAVFRKELTRILKNEMEKLPANYHTLLVLFHQENISYEEMVRITGLPEGTVKSHLFRARKMLKENLLMNYQKEAL